MPRVQRKLKKTSLAKDDIIRIRARDDIIRLRGFLPTRLDSPEARIELRRNKQQQEQSMQNHKKMLMGLGLSEAEAEEQTRKDWERAKKQKEKWANETFGRFTKKK
jgi:hypothetical protein